MVADNQKILNLYEIMKLNHPYKKAGEVKIWMTIFCFQVVVLPEPI
uniref:Uncharacterized protein n=1 Tax=viral metagenome TaxID=1070528 RepID=A0A6C0FCN9_9ZZZZ